jgi:hypothetical protein
MAAAIVLAPWWLPNVPAVKHRLAREIGRRTGLECRLGLIVPLGRDGRAHLHGVQLSRPGRREPIVSLPRVTAEIRWPALRRGRLEISRLRVDGGHLHWTPGPEAPAVSETDSTGPSAISSPTGTGAELAGAETTDTQPPPAAAGLLGTAPLTSPAIVTRHPQAAPPPAVLPAAAAPPTPVAVLPTATAAATAAGPAAAPAAGPEQRAPAPPAPVAAASGARWQLDHIQISGLSLQWLRSTTADAPPLASAMADLDIPLGSPSGTAGHTGRLRFSHLRLGNRPWPSDIEVPLHWDGRTLETGETAIAMPGGTLRLNARLLPQTPGLPLTGEASFERLAVAEMSQWAAPAWAPAAGLAEGQARFALPARHPGRLRTVGQVRLTGLVLPIAGWLDHAGLPGLAARWPWPEWPVRGAFLQFSSDGARLAVEDATLSADELTVRALGTASPGGGPALSLRACVPPGGADLLTRLSAAWPPERRLQPQPLPGSPWACLDTVLHGTWAVPAIELWDHTWPLPELRSELRRLAEPGSPPVDAPGPPAHRGGQ